MAGPTKQEAADMIADAAAHAYAQGYGLGQIKGRRDMLTHVLALLEDRPEIVKHLKKAFEKDL